MKLFAMIWSEVSLAVAYLPVRNKILGWCQPRANTPLKVELPVPAHQAAPRCSAGYQLDHVAEEGPCVLCRSMGASVPWTGWWVCGSGFVIS